MEIVYIRGGDPNAAKIAKDFGLKYGIRHDYTPYGDVWMLDINWERYNWQSYLAKVRDWKPYVAMVPDYEHHFQFTTLSKMIRDLEALVPVVAVCPKFEQAGLHIPSHCLVAVSIPAPSYAGFIPPLKQLCGRKLHLLGGRPEYQARWISALNHLDCEIYSLDGSYVNVKAAYGQAFIGNKWIHLEGQGYSTNNLVRMSMPNIVRYLHAANQTAQMSMIGF